MKREYADFLATKSVAIQERGLPKTPELASHLFPFQASVVDFSLRTGTAGCFLDTGLGKTEIQLEWCQKAIGHLNKPAIIWTPLAVAQQTKRRAERWGYEARVIREQSDVRPGVINIINYDRREKIDPAVFPIVSCDEASILKSFTGKTTRAMIEAFRGAQFKLCATATPAPNDHVELGNYAEFLELMAANEMLSRFFINDTATASQDWRLKGHAVVPFWDWMASWARMAEKPSDLGFDDTGFILPPFEIIRHKSRESLGNDAFDDIFGQGEVSMSATGLHEIKRQTIEARAELVASIVSQTKDESWLIWCDTNYESDALMRTVPSAIEVRGSQSIDEKEEKLEAFSTGKAKDLIGKPSLCGFGLDWSHCHNMIFVGRSYSYETWYQAVRRCWRFGQKKAVKVHLVVAEGEAEIGQVIVRKADDHDKMKAAMRAAMKRAMGKSEITKVPYLPIFEGRLPAWL